MPRFLKISSKGQITIPIETRNRLGARPMTLLRISMITASEYCVSYNPKRTRSPKFAGLPAFKSTESLTGAICETLTGNISEPRSAAITAVLGICLQGLHPGHIL